MRLPNITGFLLHLAIMLVFAMALPHCAIAQNAQPQSSPLLSLTYKIRDVRGKEYNAKFTDGKFTQDKFGSPNFVYSEIVAHDTGKSAGNDSDISIVVTSTVSGKESRVGSRHKHDVFLVRGQNNERIIARAQGFTPDIGVVVDAAVRNSKGYVRYMGYGKGDKDCCPMSDTVFELTVDSSGVQAKNIPLADFERNVGNVLLASIMTKYNRGAPGVLFKDGPLMSVLSKFIDRNTLLDIFSIEGPGSLNEKDGIVYWYECEAHNCAYHNYTIFINNKDKSVDVLYRNNNCSPTGSKNTWYSSGGKPKPLPACLDGDHEILYKQFHAK